MIWPPLKAWTSKLSIKGNIYFVAINYGGELSNKWVVMMAVVDSSVVVKVPWSQLIDSARWETGWNKINDLKSYKEINDNCCVRNPEFYHPSDDSGLTIPIDENSIRPWFEKV